MNFYSYKALTKELLVKKGYSSNLSKRFFHHNKFSLKNGFCVSGSCQGENVFTYILHRNSNAKIFTLKFMMSAPNLNSFSSIMHN